MIYSLQSEDCMWTWFRLKRFWKIFKRNCKKKTRKYRNYPRGCRRTLRILIMIRNDNDKLLSRIIAGFLYIDYNNKLYILKKPSVVLKYKADLLYEKIYQDNLYSDWILLQDTEFILEENGLWRLQNNDVLKQISDRLDNLKVELYQNYIQPAKRKEIKKQISSMNMQRDRILSTKHSLDQYTLEAYAGRIRNEYIIMNTLYHKNKKVFKDKDKRNSFLLNGIASKISASLPSISDIRGLARSDLWKSYWSACDKQNVFGDTVFSWTDEQRALVNISKVFDSVLEHPECPPDNIIDDEDALDGWMILQKRKNEQSKSKQKTDSMLTSAKMKKASEVFIVSSSPEETQEILNNNDAVSIHRMKEKFSAIKESDEQGISEAQLPDVQRELINQLNEKRSSMNRK